MKEADSFYIGIVAKGTGTIVIEVELIEVSEGDRFFVPHQTSAVKYTSETGMEIVATFPPA